MLQSALGFLIQLFHPVFVIAQTVGAASHMLVHILVGVVEPAQQVRGFHKVLVHLGLIARKLAAQLFNLLLRPALPQRCSLAGTANQNPDDNANYQRGNCRQNQVCHMKIVLILPGSEPIPVNGV